MDANPLLEHWTTPYGLPPFDQVQPDHFKPALEAGMDEHRREIEAIAGAEAEPSFENTVAAFHRSGETLAAVARLFHNLSASETSDELQAVEREVVPALAAHRNWVTLHEGFFRRLETLFRRRDLLELGPEQRRLLERLHTDFVRAGAELQGDARKRFAEITEELASLYTEFSQAVLADEAEYALFLESEEDRAGLPDFVLYAASSVAEQKGRSGYAINLSPSLVDPFLTYSERRDLREKVWRAYKARGETHPDRDTKPIAARIVGLRAELARLMGFETFADFALADRMAQTPSAVADLLEKVWEPAKSRAAEEQADLEAAARRAGADDTVEPWDWHYWAEGVRLAHYGLDESELKPYFSLDRMMDAMFDCARRLYGVTFAEVPDVPRYHPDVRVFEVRAEGSGHSSGGRAEASGEPLGVFIADNFARPTKRGGAWMSVYRLQSHNRARGPGYPIAATNNNFAKAADGKPTLLSFENVRTLFHEFGHALHALLSDVTYGYLAGTNVLRDFVELPSQIHENWAMQPEVLTKHAVHVDTGEPMSDELIERIRRAEQFNQGFRTVEYTACALVDLALHGKSRAELDEGDGLDIAAFEAEECRRLGVPPAIGLRHRLPHFRHLFAGNGYAAGYYVYMWAEVLEADAFEAFRESGNVFDPELAERFRANILSAGNAVDPAHAYRRFRGRAPEVEPMIRKRGLV